MGWFRTKNIKIAGVSAVVPKQKVDIKTYKTRFGESAVDKFIKSTGIQKLHISKKEQTAADLGYEAAKYLMDTLEVERSKIKLLIFVSDMPDYFIPATSCTIQMRLGLSQDCAAFDIPLGCSGFVYGHQVMENMMEASDMEYGLLILGSTTSKGIGEKDHTSMMFGDAGAAVLYSREPGAGSASLLHTNGSGFKTIILPGGGFRDPTPSKEEYVCSDGMVRTKYNIFMNGLEVFAFAIHVVPHAIDEYLHKLAKKLQDYDLIVFHQANKFIIRQLMKKLHIEKEKTAISLDRYGNTSSVSIPLTICDYYGNQTGKKEKVMAVGFGVGLSWGVTSFEIDVDTVLPIIETENYFEGGIIDLTAL